jgi:hypothetical protein
MKAPRLDPVIDRPSTEAEIVQLDPRNDAVLSSGQ